MGPSPLLQQLAVVIDSTPLRFSVVDIQHPSGVEHVAADVEIFAVFRTFEVDEGGKQEDHVAALVHDGSAAVGAANLAREFVHAGLLR